MLSNLGISGNKSVDQTSFQDQGKQQISFLVSTTKLKALDFKFTNRLMRSEFHNKFVSSFTDLKDHIIQHVFCYTLGTLSIRLPEENAQRKR